MAAVAGPRAARRDTSRRRIIPLFWRLFIPNAAVLFAACVFLIVAPPNGRAAILVSGLVVMLLTNLALMRWAFAPLQRLFALMRRVDPLAPGRRLSVGGPESEVTELTRAFNDMLDRLEDERRDSARRALAAQEAERRRVASELHDEVGQALTAVLLELDRIGRAAPAQLQEEILYARETAANSLEDVRRIARRLRPEALDDLGLVSALINLSERMEEATGVQIERRLERTLPPLSPEAELVIYRIAQESLTNAARHAEGEAIELALEAGGGSVRLIVRDDGRGFDPASEGNLGGIRGMRERALLVGAHLHIESSPGTGTRVSLELDALEGRPS
jgi:two-component system, NarL family, sensor histidine kinase UhpB